MSYAAAGGPELSNRTRYPGFFRTRVPFTPFSSAWLAFATLCGWNRLGVVVGETERFAGIRDQFVAEATKAGFLLPVLEQLVSLKTQAAPLIRKVTEMRLRVLVGLVSLETWTALLCEQRNQYVAGIFWMTSTWSSGGLDRRWMEGPDTAVEASFHPADFLATRKGPRRTRRDLVSGIAAVCKDALETRCVEKATT